MHKLTAEEKIKVRAAKAESELKWARWSVEQSKSALAYDRRKLTEARAEYITAQAALRNL